MKNKMAQILIVDDDSENGKFLEESLAQEGCHTVRFEDPREALTRVQKARFQVGILDLKMPHMDGVELFNKIREKDPEISIIMLTGYPSVDSALATLKTGAYDYIKKPYKIDDLRKIVQRLLEEKGFFIDHEAQLNRSIGERIKFYRTQHGWTIAKLAAQTQLSKSLLSQLENAKNSASLVSLSRIARSLKVRVVDLLNGL